MAKKDFIKRYKEDWSFRWSMKQKGIYVIQNNVIFFNPDGTVKGVAGNFIL